jgi:hypothetical protein
MSRSPERIFLQEDCPDDIVAVIEGVLARCAK